MVTAEQINKLFSDMGFPSQTIFYKKLRRMGIPVTMKMIQEFVSSRSERSLMAPGPKYEGKIVAFDINHKMAIDVISFVSKPVKTNSGEMSYVLICQDIFSRKIYTRPMVELSQTTSMFEDILKEQELFDNENKYPDVLNSDKGGEFTSENFKALCQRYNIRQVFKVGINDIATVDSAIAVLKRIIKRLENNKGGNWWSLLGEAEKYITTQKTQPLKPNPMRSMKMKI